MKSYYSESCEAFQLVLLMEWTLRKNINTLLYSQTQICSIIMACQAIFFKMLYLDPSV